LRGPFAVYARESSLRPSIRQREFRVEIVNQNQPRNRQSASRAFDLEFCPKNAQ